MIGRLARVSAGARVLGGIAAVACLLFAGFYAFVTWSGDHITGASDFTKRETYRWEGDRLMLINAVAVNHTSHCVIKPDQGEEREIPIRPGSLGRYTMADPWFNGAATVSCGESVNLFTGSAVDRWHTTHSAWFTVAWAAGTGVPLIGAVVLGVRGRSRVRTSRHYAQPA